MPDENMVFTSGATLARTARALARRMFAAQGSTARGFGVKAIVSAAGPVPAGDILDS